VHRIARRARGPGRAARSMVGQFTDVPAGPDTELEELDPEPEEPDPLGLMTISRASLVPPATGPPANTVWPADSAPAVVLLPFSLITVLLTITQVQIVPSGARTTTSVLLADWTVPRSNASVWKPVLLWKVNSPCTPPRAHSRPSAHLIRGNGTDAVPLAVLSAEFSAAP